jgi:predicted nucleic acid-binding protein
VIVVDTNVIAALVLPTSDKTEMAMRLLEVERDWAAPVLWRSEFTNILATGVRNSWFDLPLARGALVAAEDVIGDAEFTVPAEEVLELAASSGCTGYDVEFVVLAQDLAVRLITLDKEILRAFPEVAVPLHHLADAG